MSDIKVSGKSYFICFYCGNYTHESHFTKDHIIPRSVLEKHNCIAIADTNFNLIKVCTSCNIKKGASPLQDFLKKKYKTPKT